MNPPDRAFHDPTNEHPETHGGPWVPVPGDFYNHDTGQVDYGTTAHINAWGERREPHYRI